MDKPAFPTWRDDATMIFGMTLADYYAGKALQGLLANPHLQEHIIKNGGANSGWIEESASTFGDELAKLRSKNESI